MTRRDYAMVAGIIRANLTETNLSGPGWAALTSFSKDLALAMRERDEFLDTDAFLRAAGVRQ